MSPTALLSLITIHNVDLKINYLFYISGDKDEERKLTKLGITQAKETGKSLNSLPFTFDRVYA
eukprot:Awhi_evm1s13048